MNRRDVTLSLGAASLLLAAPFLLLITVVFVLPLATLLHESLFLPEPSTAHYARARGSVILSEKSDGLSARTAAPLWSAAPWATSG